MVCWNTEEKRASESKILFYVVLILIQNENALHFKRGRFGRCKIHEDKDVSPPHLDPRVF